MSRLTIEYTETLVVRTCWCGMAHAIPRSLSEFVDRKHRDGKEHFVYCPLGHQWTPAGKGEYFQERERREAAEVRASQIADQLAAEKRAHNRTKAKAKTANTRARNGVCPHPDCKRSFVDVARHVRSKHPELVEAS